MKINGKEKCSKTGLIYVAHDTPGIQRKKQGRRFIYFDKNQKKISQKSAINRIENLSIPPMWKDVWICQSPNGYLQATGLDEMGRKQYLYHKEWTAHQQNLKFQKLLEFGYALTEIRKKVKSHLRKKGWHKEKVIALIVSILDETYIRIGNKIYQDLHGTYGLTTLRRKNLEILQDGILFKYKAKSQKYKTVKLKSKRFKRLIKECSELSGYEVFRYEDKSGKTIPVESKDVNEYLNKISGENFTSKNFRTWGATVLAIKNYPIALQKVKENKRLKLKRSIVKEVAKELDNTISVCEKYYIHPTVLSALLDEDYSSKKFKVKDKPKKLKYEEKLVLSILESAN